MGFGGLCKVQWSSDGAGRSVRLCVCVWMSECLRDHEEKHPTFQKGAAFVESCQNQAIFAV